MFYNKKQIRTCSSADTHNPSMSITDSRFSQQGLASEAICWWRDGQAPLLLHLFLALDVMRDRVPWSTSIQEKCNYTGTQKVGKKIRWWVFPLWYITRSQGEAVNVFLCLRVEDESTMFVLTVLQIFQVSHVMSHSHTFRLYLMLSKYLQHMHWPRCLLASEPLVLHMINQQIQTVHTC